MCYNHTMRKKDIVEDNGKSVESELIERLSFNEHLRWTKWQRHVHASCEQNEDGSLTIPKEKVARWERQIVTDYENLPEPEKEADRRQVRQILNIIKNFYKNKNPKGIIIAGFGAIGKTWLGQHYETAIDMESGFYAYMNEGYEHIDVEERKGTTYRLPNAEWPQNYFKAIIEARKHYDILLTSMHWELLKFFEKNKIPYYLAFPEQGSEEVMRQRCYQRGNNQEFTERMIKNIKLWGKKLKKYKPVKLLIVKKDEYLEDVLKREKIL